MAKMKIKNHNQSSKTKSLVDTGGDNGYRIPEVTLPVSLVVSDLTKTGIVTILALIFQFSLAAYLYKGGWENINTMLYKIFSLY